MNDVTLPDEIEANPGFPTVSFGRSADGMVVALMGGTAFAMLPGRGGKHFLATAYGDQ